MLQRFLRKVFIISISALLTFLFQSLSYYLGILPPPPFFTSLPKEDRTSQDTSQPLLSFPSAVPLGGEGLLGGLPLICHHQKERTKPHAPRASSPAVCTPAGLSMVRASRSRALLTLPMLPLPGTEKAPSGEGAEGLHAPGPPNAA